MLMIRSWRKHNRRILKDVTRNRVKRKIAIDAPLSLERIILSTRLDSHFAVFAETVGGRCAESFFVRTLQYAAEHDGRHGRIEVPRERFGPAVLTTAWDVVSRKDGERCYDALLASGICVPFVRGQDCGQDCDCGMGKSADKSADTSRDVLRPASCDLRPSSSPTPSGDGGEDAGSVSTLNDLAAQVINATESATPIRHARRGMNADAQRAIAAQWAEDERRAQVGRGA